MIGALTLSLLLITGQGKASAPEFVGAPKDWLQKPTSLKALHGKLVLVDFWDYTCVNCIRTFPYVKEWYRRYHKLGLEIVAIHSPEFKFEQDPKNVLAAAKRFGFTFSILNDPQKVNWTNYQVYAWPTKLLLDPNGVSIYFHVGESGYYTTEKRIQTELLKLHPDAKMPPIMDAVHETDQAGAVCHPCTLEMYMGAKGIANGDVAVAPSLIGSSASLSYPPAVTKEGIVYLAGKWSPRTGYLAPAGAGSNMEFRYSAREVNTVAVPSAGPVQLEVLQDGIPLAASDLGSDVHLVNGHAVLKTDASRMYSVVKNHVWGRHLLELKIMNPGLRMYTFSFSTDCAYLPPKRARVHRT